MPLCIAARRSVTLALAERAAALRQTASLQRRFASSTAAIGHPPVSLAYRRATLGSTTDAGPRRFAADDQPAAAVATLDSPRRLPLILSHCLLGDSKQFTLFETHLHTALRDWNQQQVRPADQVHLDAWAIDLRNHGSSPHTSRHTLAGMVEDLKSFVEHHHIERPVMLGHSMGAKSTLAYALTVPHDSPLAPSCVISLDASPAAYSHTHSAIFTSMVELDLSDPLLVKRKDVEERLRRHLPSPTDRAFVMSNLTELPSQTPRFRWRINLPVLVRDEKHVHGWTVPPPAITPDGCTPSYPGPVLFVGGGRSSRLTTADYTRAIPHYFSRYRIEMVPTAAHFVHQSHGKECAAFVIDFITSQLPPRTTQ